MFQQLLEAEFLDGARHWITVVFFWSGFAAWVGMIVGAGMRSRTFQRPWTSFCLGWIGVALGPVIVRTFLDAPKFDPISPAGIASAFVCSALTIVLYHVFIFLFPGREDDEDDPDEEEEKEEIRRMKNECDNMSRDELAAELMKMRREEMIDDDRPRKRRR